MSSLIEVNNLSKSYDGENYVFKNISFNVKEGEVVSIIGPSGTGKSTLLRCMNYLTVPNSGSIKIGDALVDAQNHNRTQVRKLREKTSMVFQSYNTFNNKTALENVMEALIVVQKYSKEEAQEKAEKFLKKVGLIHKKDSYPSRMSGGEKQRVGIARALAVNPEVILLDEPTSSLDTQLVRNVLKTIKELADDGMTMILVTHEIKFAKEVSDTIIFMDNGKIIEMGQAKKIIDTPETEELKSFLKTEMN